MWITPLSDDKKQFFATVKKAGLPLTMTYTYKGKQHDIGSGDSFLTIDSAIGFPNYGMSYFFAILQGKSVNGHNIGLLLQDGIGAQYNGLDRASEDSITVDGKVYKLGTSRL